MAERRSTKTASSGAKRPRCDAAKRSRRRRCREGRAKVAQVLPKASAGRPGPGGEPNMIAVRGAREHNLATSTSTCRATGSIVLHRPLRVGQVVARVRHDLRRGPAPLRRVAVVVRAPVPRADGQARRRLHRGPVAGDLDRPEVGVAATRARRSARSPRSTTTCACSTRASASRTARSAAGSSPARRRSRSSTASSSCPRARASRCSRRSCGAARASTRAAHRARRSRASPGPASTARSSSSRTAPRTRLARYENTPSRSSSTGWCAGRASSAGSPTRSRPRCASPKASPRSRSSRGTAKRAEPEIAHVLRAPRLHPLRALVRRARAAELLVQLAVRRVRALRRPRHALRGRPRADRRATTTSRLADGAIAPWTRVPRRVLQPGARGRRRRVRVLASTRRGRSSTKAQQKVVLYGTGRAAGARPVQEPVRPQALSTRRATRASIPWLERRHTEADSDRSRGADRGLHARGAVPRVRRRAAAARVARRSRSADRNISEVGNLSIRKTAEFFARARAVRARPADRRAGAQGGQRAAAVPARRRPRLPEPQPVVGHAGRRRGAAHPARQPDRQRPRRRALRARRAVDRAAPAGQPAPHRHDGPPARPRQHRDRRRARRGDDPGRRPHRRHRSGRGGARRRDRGRGLARGRARASRARSPASTSPGKRTIEVPELRRQPGDAWIKVRGAREHNLDNIDVELPARLLRRGHRRERQRQEHARQRHPLPRR